MGVHGYVYRSNTSTISSDVTPEHRGFKPAGIGTFSADSGRKAQLPGLHHETLLEYATNVPSSVWHDHKSAYIIVTN